MLPFLLLVTKHTKRVKPVIAVIAGWMLFMHFVDMHWLVMPANGGQEFGIKLLDITTMVGIGGLFLAAFGFFLTRAKLVPARDPRLIESITFENF